MRLYTGLPRQRMGIAHPRCYRDPRDGVYKMRMSHACQVEITRLWGLSLFGVFIGVQRYRGTQDAMAGRDDD